jgi:hypothetical protein
MDPLPAGMLNSLTHAIEADLLIMVAADRKNRRNVAERANQISQPAQLGATVHQVAAQQHDIRMATGHGMHDLPAQRVGATVSEMDVTDIHKSTRVVPRRESLLADVQGSTQPDFQQ